MKLSIDVLNPSSSDWVDCVMNDFDSFLVDHADCERKASAMAMSFIAKYPDRTEIIPELIETGIEELEHFQRVYAIMEDRGLTLPSKLHPDPYVTQLLQHCHSGRNERFLDRLLIASVVECRGAERFKMVAEHLSDLDLKKFYKELWTSEAKHGHIFVKMSLIYFPEKNVYDRLRWWMEIEDDIIGQLDLKPALH